jgi:hypothetical protein
MAAIQLEMANPPSSINRVSRWQAMARRGCVKLDIQLFLARWLLFWPTDHFSASYNWAAFLAGLRCLMRPLWTAGIMQWLRLQAAATSSHSAAGQQVNSICGVHLAWL